LRHFQFVTELLSTVERI